MYQYARSSLLSVLIFTLINSVLALLGSGTYFLFSASIPYTFASESAYFFYYPEESLFAELQGELDPKVVLIVGAVLSILTLVPYLLCWIFSKKHYGWLIAALVMFGLDTLAMLMLYNLIAVILDVLFHAAILVILSLGVYNALKLKKLEAQAAEQCVVEKAAEAWQTDGTGEAADPSAHIVVRESDDDDDYHDNGKENKE